MKHRVVVMFGGRSTEHEVSCLTAAGVIASLDPSKYELFAVGISHSGTWHRYDPAVVAQLSIDGTVMPEVDRSQPQAIFVPTSDGIQLATVDGASLFDLTPVDVVFPLLHGPYGEDGTLQGQLEMLGLRYVGSGVCASALSMDKHTMKMVFESAGIPIGPYVVINPAQWNSDRQGCLDEVAKLTLPVFVKPARGGSSVGISKVNDLVELAAAIDLAAQYDPKVIIEQGIMGAREIECAVLGSHDGGQPRTSLVGEIAMVDQDAFYDYEAKYRPDNQVQLSIPADVSDKVLQRVQQLAARCFETVGCEGLARVDTFVTPDEDVIVNEINTMPGFTRYSMFPSLWEATGMAYPQLLDELISLALNRPTDLR